MTINSTRLATLITHVQDAFLDSPALVLTPDDIQDRFGIDRTTCEAVLGTLVDAHVLASRPGRRYVRFFPDPSRQNGCAA